MPEKKTKTAPAPATEKKKKNGHGGARKGAGRKPAMTLEEKITLGVAKTRDYKLLGYANATAYKRGQRLGTATAAAPAQTEESIDELFGDGNKKPYLGWPDGRKEYQ